MKVVSVKDYLEKSGDSRLLDGNTEVSDKGFCIWETSETNLILLQVYGDGRYWNDWATKKAKELNKQKISFGTKLNPDIFDKHGFKVIGYILEREV